MNKTATVSLLAVSALLFAPKPAAAGDKEIAAIGGFIGGLILGSHINHEHHHRPPVVEAPACPPPSVVVYESGGVWDYRPTRVWIAPRWIVTYDDCHRPVRRYIAGHYETRHERVWVARRSSHNLHGHHSNAHYYGNANRHDRHDRKDRRSNRHERH